MVSPASPAVALRVNQLSKQRELAGLTDDTRLASAMRMHRVTVTRVVSGEMQPGAKFIAGALHAFPSVRFEDLFEITEQASA